MALLWKGAPVAAAITEQLIPRAAALKARGIVPTIAIVRLGESRDDLTYENAAIKRCERVGIAVRRFICTPDDLLPTIDGINGDGSIHGCLLLRPLPDKALEQAACERLAPEKDMEVPPCTAQACMELLDFYGVPLPGKKVCVVGRSAVVGKPVRQLLENRGAEVTVCHSRTEDLPGTCRKAELLLSAVGKARLITAECVNAGHCIVDVGINETADGGLCGDVDFAAVEPLVQAITPVPGGVGNVTTAVLCKHLIEAAERT